MANFESRTSLEDETMKDYRRMLYRLDLATSFRSVEALLHHFTSETPLDGFIEIRVYSVYPSPDAPVSVCPTPSARLSFCRDLSSGEVLADKLFEPTRDTSDKYGDALYRQRYTVAQVYPPGTLLSQAFNPIIQPLLKGNRSTLVFEYRAFLRQPSPMPDPLDECEVVNRQAPHKLMVGYVGRTERGALSAYQLDDHVARTTFVDMNPMAFHVGTANKDLGRDPQVIKNIPNRFHGLEGKTIAIDATLVTQRLHFNPDPRPHRHVLGWYQLIAELRQHGIKVVARRRQLRLQAETRAAWEKSRHERLQSLTEVLLNLETLPQAQQQDILGELQAHIDNSRMSLIDDKADADLPLGPLSGDVEAPTASEQLAHEPPRADATRIEEYEIPTPSQPGTIEAVGGATSDIIGLPPSPNIGDSAKASSSDVSETNDTIMDEEVYPTVKENLEESHSPESHELDVSSGTPDQEGLPVLSSEASLAKDPPLEPCVPSPSNHGDVSQSAADTSALDASLSTPFYLNLPNPPISPYSSIGSAQPPEGTRDDTESNMDFPAGPNDSQYLSKIIHHLHQHYVRTSSIAADGLIHARTEPNHEALPDIPISRVQLKYTQEELKLWEQLAPTSKGSTIDIAQVVERVQELAAVELPKEEPEVETIDQAIEPEDPEESAPISEWSAALEEQSGFMVASLTRRANPPTSSTYAESRLILETMGVPCVESPMHYEAEALAASIVINGLADFVGSEDTDVLMYNAPLLRHMTNKKVPLQIIPPDAQNSLGLSRSSFIDTGILMGTDFVRRVKKVGPITAYRLMQKYESIERMLEEESKLRPPDVADYLEKVKVARLIFSSLPPAPSPESIAQGDWDEKAIQEVMAHFGLTNYMKEIEEQLIPDALSDNYFSQESKVFS